MVKRNKLDEMENAINTESAIYAYRFIIIVLIMWCLFGIFMSENWGVPLYILIAQLFVKFIVKQLGRHRVGDERWKNSVIRLVAIVAIALFVILFVIPNLLIGIARG